MAKVHLPSGFPTKRLIINKANATMVIAIAVATFVTVFCLITAKALLSQRAYQARVITRKEKAKDQLKENIKSVEALDTSYKEFVSSPVNVLDGNPAGTGEKDGDNPRIVLDALPSKYDFPALATSLEKLLTDRNYKVDGITGTDEEIAQQSN